MGEGLGDVRVKSGDLFLANLGTETPDAPAKLSEGLPQTPANFMAAAQNVQAAAIMHIISAVRLQMSSLFELGHAKSAHRFALVTHDDPIP